MCHVRNVLLKVTNIKLRCSLCDALLANKTILKGHIDVKHGEVKDVQDLKCRLCMKQYSTNASLKYQIKTIHEGMKTHKCQICDYASNNKLYLEGHIKCHHLIVEEIMKRNNQEGVNLCD